MSTTSSRSSSPIQHIDFTTIDFTKEEDIELLKKKISKLEATKTQQKMVDKSKADKKALERLAMPSYSGDIPAQLWITKVKNIMKCRGLTEETTIQLSMASLKGAAEAYIEPFFDNIKTIDNLKDLLTNRFSPELTMGNVMNKMSKVTYNGCPLALAQDLSTCAARCKSIPESETIDYFLRAIPPAYAASVARDNTLTTLNDVAMAVFAITSRTSETTAHSAKGDNKQNNNKTQTQPQGAPTQKYCDFHKSSTHSTAECHGKKKACPHCGVKGKHTPRECPEARKNIIQGDRRSTQGPPGQSVSHIKQGEQMSAYAPQYTQPPTQYSQPPTQYSQPPTQYIQPSHSQYTPVAFYNPQ